MDSISVLNKSMILLSLMVFVIGVSTIFLRRHAVWCLIGQIVAVKAVAAAAFLISRIPGPSSGDLLLLSLLAMGMVPLVSLVGVLVLHRCGRFGGTLEYDKEDSLRN